jgi:hypothetical protein
MKSQAPKPTYEELLQLVYTLSQENQTLKDENLLLKGRLAWLERKVFGPSSEHYRSEDQLSLFSNELAPQTPQAPEVCEHKEHTPSTGSSSPTENKKKPHPGRNPIPGHLILPQFLGQKI